MALICNDGNGETQRLSVRFVILNIVERAAQGSLTSLIDGFLDRAALRHSRTLLVSTHRFLHGPPYVFRYCFCAHYASQTLHPLLGLVIAQPSASRLHTR